MFVDSYFSIFFLKASLFLTDELLPKYESSKNCARCGTSTIERTDHASRNDQEPELPNSNCTPNELSVIHDHHMQINNNMCHSCCPESLFVLELSFLAVLAGNFLLKIENILHLMLQPLKRFF